MIIYPCIIYLIDSIESLEILLSIIKENNDSGPFWIGASDLNSEVGHFKWFYSGKTISETNWALKGRPTNIEESRELDQVCVPIINCSIPYLITQILILIFNMFGKYYKYQAQILHCRQIKVNFHSIPR